MVKRACLNEFIKMWVNDDRPTNLKLIKGMTGNWDSCKRNNRREEIILSRMRLGHTKLPHSYIIDQDIRPECDTCDRALTVRHLLTYCTKYDEQRRQLIGLCQNHHMELGMGVLLGDNYPDITDAVFGFLRDCDLYTKI